MPPANEPIFIVPSDLDKDGGYKLEHKGATTPPVSSSTSAGSETPPPSSPESDALLPVDAPMSQALTSQIPEFDYPSPFPIRNTFIDTGIMRPLSFDEFYTERMVRSCPIPPPPGLESEETPKAQVPDTVKMGHAMMASVAAAAAASAAAAAAVAAAANPTAMSWMMNSPATPQPPSPGASFGDMTPKSPKPDMQAPVLRLADALAEPELGSAAMPTIGSAAHRTGNCKPCAFFHTKGCESGKDCSFCHLCPAGEKKKRQKDKIGFQREMRRLGLQL